MRARASWVTGVLLIASCNGGGDAGENASATYPPGTALAVDGRAISPDAIDYAAARIAVVYPDRTHAFHVTQALQSFVLPREALRSRYAESREEARALCDLACDEMDDILFDGEGGEEHTGDWMELTLFYWAEARKLQVGAWVGPLERIGSFCLIQLVALEPGLTAREDVVTVRVLDFPYVPADFSPDALDQALEAARLEVVDPAYDALVPELLRYKMKGRKP